MDLHANSLRRAIVILCAVVLTAGAYFVSSGLQRLWWPVWLAPLPVLLLAPRLRAWQAFAVALVARTVAAALNFWHYVHNIVQFPLWLVLVTILVPAASFALAVVFYRGLLRKGNPWLAMLAFPVTIVAAEYLSAFPRAHFSILDTPNLATFPFFSWQRSPAFGESVSVSTCFPPDWLHLSQRKQSRVFAWPLLSLPVTPAFFSMVRYASTPNLNPPIQFS
jgi:hypothetical protein